MPAKYKDYPIYRYNEPATYDDFTGGINTDPSNDRLTDKEMRDCVNMTYLSGALIKRKGAKEIARFECEDSLHNIQGVFLYTYRITYIIVAADGKLYYGIWNKNTTIQLTRLPIYKTIEETYLTHDPYNCLVDIEETTPANEYDKTDGYVQTYCRNSNTGELIKSTEKGNFANVLNSLTTPSTVLTSKGVIKKGNVYYVTYTDGHGSYLRKYICTQDFELCTIGSQNTDYFEVWRPTYETIVNQYKKANNNANPPDTDETINGWTNSPQNIPGTYGFGIINWSSNLTSCQFGKLYKYQDVVYICRKTHINYLSYGEAVLNLNVFSSIGTTHVPVKYLIFQNYKDVQAATINNKLYIATGTRIIEVGLSEDKLYASPVTPKMLNYNEIVNIGYNYMSPYPELAVDEINSNATATSMTGIKISKLIGGAYKLQPTMNLQSGDTIEDYCFKWEKYIDGQWLTIVTYNSQLPSYKASDTTANAYPVKTKASAAYTIQVDDADQYVYRCSFAKDFENESVNTAGVYWENKNYNKGDIVHVGSKLYECIYNTSNVTFESTDYFCEIGSIHKTTTTGNTTTTTVVTIPVWQPIYNTESIQLLNINGEIQLVKDVIVNELGDYFGSATSVLYDPNLKPNDMFLQIQSCTKVIADGNKLLFYDDAYNTGWWFKTIINEPGYITQRGCLSFKTTKNEAVVNVTPFQGNLIVFANSEDAGGSIHLVKGNGDDYDADDGYYSPYQRSTINASISCNNAKTIQICDNILVFKYFNRLYYISASDLSNDVVKVTQCNERILSKSTDVEIPWDDNSCISEVTSSYYALIWPEKYEYDTNIGDLILKHPGMRVKMYYNMSYLLEDTTYSMPWLRDESEYFNIKHIIYLDAMPIYLYHNVLISFNEDTYEDLGEIVPTRIHLKGYDTEYPTLFKFLTNVLLNYHRDQYEMLSFEAIAKNEAGHHLIDTSNLKKTLGDLKALKEGSTVGTGMRIGSTIVDQRLITPSYMMPYMYIDVDIKEKNKGIFGFSSVTFNYTATDTPDSTPYDIYSNIIRPNEIK